MRLLTNPLVVRAAIVLFCASFSFMVGIIVIRRLRKNIDEESHLSSEGSPSLETLPLHLYNTVIQQLKQQKRELEVQTQTEQRRARTTENFSQAVLSNLSSGVLVFGMNGLVKQSNPAAKKILGFTSPAGMSAEEIFRGAAVSSDSNLDGSAAASAAVRRAPSPAVPTARPRDSRQACPEPSRRDTGANLSAADDGFENTLVPLAGEVHSVLREGSNRRQVEADYITPGGEKRHIAVTVSPVPSVDGTLLGAACLINDRSEFERIRRQQELHGEISAEMALALRTSLTTISGYAQQLARNRDPELAEQLAADIAEEAAQLDHSIGGFLTEKRALSGRAAPAGSANR